MTAVYHYPRPKFEAQAAIPLTKAEEQKRQTATLRRIVLDWLIKIGNKEFTAPSTIENEILNSHFLFTPHPLEKNQKLLPAHPFLLLEPFIGIDKDVDSRFARFVLNYRDKPYYSVKTNRTYYPDGTWSEGRPKAEMARTSASIVTLDDRDGVAIPRREIYQNQVGDMTHIYNAVIVPEVPEVHRVEDENVYAIPQVAATVESLPEIEIQKAFPFEIEPLPPLYQAVRYEETPKIPLREIETEVLPKPQRPLRFAVEESFPDAKTGKATKIEIKNFVPPLPHAVLDEIEGKSQYLPRRSKASRKKNSLDSDLVKIPYQFKAPLPHAVLSESEGESHFLPTRSIPSRSLKILDKDIVKIPFEFKPPAPKSRKSELDSRPLKRTDASPISNLRKGTDLVGKPFFFTSPKNRATAEYIPQPEMEVEDFVSPLPPPIQPLMEIEANEAFAPPPQPFYNEPQIDLNQGEMDVELSPPIPIPRKIQAKRAFLEHDDFIPLSHSAPSQKRSLPSLKDDVVEFGEAPLFPEDIPPIPTKQELRLLPPLITRREIPRLIKRVAPKKPRIKYSEFGETPLYPTDVPQIPSKQEAKLVTVKKSTAHPIFFKERKAPKSKFGLKRGRDEFDQQLQTTRKKFREMQKLIYPPPPIMEEEPIPPRDTREDPLDLRGIFVHSRYSKGYKKRAGLQLLARNLLHYARDHEGFFRSFSSLEDPIEISEDPLQVYNSIVYNLESSPTASVNRMWDFLREHLENYNLSLDANEIWGGLREILSKSQKGSRMISGHGAFL